MAGVNLLQEWRRMLGGLSVLVVSVVVGCDEGTYPAGLTYPVRQDLLVIKSPSEQPTYPDPPGELDRMIAKISSLQGQTINPAELSSSQRADLAKALTIAFGTPSKPKVQVPEAEDEDAEDEDAEAIKSAIELLRLDEKTLARGSSLYRRHCLHCHGLAGDGRGASGAWLNPHPRDYRQGKFKFMSSEGGEARKPRRADLYRTLYAGIEGTSMPAFNMLPETDLDAMVSYVIHLSIRGETEFNTIQTILTGGEIIGDSIEKHVFGWEKRYLVDRWAASDTKILKPTSTPTYTAEQLEKSILNGYKLFTDTQGAASCINCHVDFGRQVPYRYDDWGTLVRPLNLTVGTYRGGRRPIDLFWRVKGGINPSGMPAAGSLTDDSIWDVVNFLQALPYPKMLPEEIRDKIYVPLTQVASH